MGNDCQCQDRCSQQQVEKVPVKDSAQEHRLTDGLTRGHEVETDSTGTPTVEPVANITSSDAPPYQTPLLPESLPTSEKSSPRSDSKLMVTVVGTLGLRNANWFPGTGKSDCYCVLRTMSDQQLHTTKIVNDTLDPMWNEEVEVEYVPGESLEFGIWDKDLVRNNFLGRAVLDIKDFESSGFTGELEVQNAGRGVEACLHVKVKHAGQDYPQGPPMQLTTVITKVPGKPVGVDLDITCGAAGFICGINDGAFAAYNKITSPEAQLNVGDYITKVNGVEGDGMALLERLKKDTVLEVTFQRPFIYIIAISRKHAKQPLGVNLSEIASGNSLLIKEVTEGPVQVWNSAHPALAVRPGDRIVAVGGKRGSAAELVKASKVGKQLQLVISRPTTSTTASYMPDL
mmetsp:Transcript_74173/g.146964  ORF Transcript_74173/g.146964 Transcript_74173/m.146964 type:complete len:400 (-) Transcript_74173:111-1310(-)